MNKDDAFKVLLVEPANLLRRTVALTVRDLGSAEVIEAATYASAYAACERRPFDGAVIAVESPLSSEQYTGLNLIQQIRAGRCACAASIPIAVLVESCNTELLGLLRASSISRILIKPFRVRDVIDTIDAMRERAAATAQ